MSEQNTKTKKGLKWSIIDQVVKQIITLLISAVLSRLLSPAEFGLLGMVTVAIGFLQVIKDIGLGSSIIQKQGITEEEQSTIFWLNLILGLGMALLLIVLAPLISEFFNEPKLTLLIRIMSINFVISSMAIVPDALILKAIDFKSYFFRNVGTTILGGFIGIWMAYRGFGVWALVGQSLLTTITGLFISFGMIKWRPGFIFRKDLLKSHLRYSMPLLADSSLNYWVRNIDNLLVGKFLGVITLGIYNRAYTLMLIPVRQIANTLSRVMFPSFSLIQENKNLIWDQYNKMISSIAMISFYVMSVLGVYAKEIILIIYGENWIDVVPIFKILCFLGAMQSIATIAGPIYYSSGKTFLLFKVGLISKTLMILGIVVGLIYGNLSSMVIGYSITSCISFIIESYFVGKILDKTLINFFSSFIVELFSSLVCFSFLQVCYIYQNEMITNPIKFILLNLFIVSISIFIYALLLKKLKSKGFLIILNHIYERKRKRV